MTVGATELLWLLKLAVAIITVVSWSGLFIWLWTNISRVGGGD